MRTLVFFFLLFLVSCTHTIHTHGVTSTNIELWNEIKVGDNKEKVIKILGAPTLVSRFDENIWYYISYKIKQSNCLGKRRYSSKSLQILFNQNDNRVKDIRKITIAERFLIAIDSKLR
ncbi:MAG: outer membrane protein assembly factor BamE [Wolbachia endosymbiont of Meromenopon meropis]|nr:outer membrane protein assembly factor BamE [Wolbachia endosymbiont of Meromenopon meropis]